VDTAGRCLQPVHKADFKKNTCEKLCSHELLLVAGYRLYAGQEVKGKIAESTPIRSKVDYPQDCQTSIIQGDLSKSSLAILKDTIIKLRYQ